MCIKQWDSFHDCFIQQMKIDGDFVTKNWKEKKKGGVLSLKHPYLGELFEEIEII